MRKKDKDYLLAIFDINTDLYCAIDDFGIDHDKLTEEQEDNLTELRDLAEEVRDKIAEVLGMDWEDTHSAAMSLKKPSYTVASDFINKP